MNKINKKGMSEAVTTVLFILISLVAFLTLAQFALPFVKNQLSKGSECVPYNNYFQFEEQFVLEADVKNYNCFITGATTKVGASINANPSKKDVSENVQGLMLYVFYPGGSKSFKVPSSDISLFEGGPATLMSNGETQTYIASLNTNENDPISLEVRPILKSGKICEISDRIRLKQCSGISL